MSGRLHVLTDAREGGAPLQVVAAALSAGAPVVQVRAKGCTDRELYDFALRVAGLRAPVRAGELVAEGADYLGVGPAYAIATKAGLPAPLGAAGVGAVASVVQMPVIASGGVTAARVPELLAAGAYGVAVVGAVSGAADPAAAVRELLRALEAAP